MTDLLSIRRTKALFQPNPPYIVDSQKLLYWIRQEVDPNLEMTEICDRTLRAKGPALLFENVKGSDIPVLGNLGICS